MTATDLQAIGRQARTAARLLSICSGNLRDAALLEIARRLEQADGLMQANEADITEARAANLTPALIDRLTLTPERIAGMAQGCRDMAALPDPLGETFDGRI